jgi:hypothetical protein
LLGLRWTLFWNRPEDVDGDRAIQKTESTDVKNTSYLSKKIVSKIQINQPCVDFNQIGIDFFHKNLKMEINDADSSHSEDLDRDLSNWAI